MAISPYTQDNEKKKFKESSAVAGQPGVVVVNADGSSVGGSVTSIVPGTGATNLGKAEDGASADGDVGVGMLAVRKATPANTSGTDGDYEFLQMSAGRLWASSIITDIVPGTGATNLGKAVDAVAGASDTGVAALFVRTDAPTTLTPADGDYARARIDSIGLQWVREYYAPVYEDNTVGKAVVEHRYTPAFVQADTAVKSGAGLLHTLTFSCNDAAPTAGSIIAYDNTAESGTVLFNHTFTTTPFTPFSVVLDVSFATGLYIGFTTTNDVNVTVSYR